MEVLSITVPSALAVFHADSWNAVFHPSQSRRNNSGLIWRVIDVSHATPAASSRASIHQKSFIVHLELPPMQNKTGLCVKKIYKVSGSSNFLLLPTSFWTDITFPWSFPPETDVWRVWEQQTVYKWWQCSDFIKCSAGLTVIFKRMCIDYAWRQSIGWVLINLDLSSTLGYARHSCKTSCESRHMECRILWWCSHCEWQLCCVIQQNELFRLKHFATFGSTDIISYWHTTTGLKVSQSLV